MFNFDLQRDDLCHLEEITAGYAFGEILEIALKKDLFTAVEEGKDIEALSQHLGFDLKATELLIKALTKLGLLGMKDGYIFNTPVSSKYLAAQSQDNAVNNLLAKTTNPKYLAKKIAAFFPQELLKGNVLNNTALPELNQEFALFQPELTFNHQDKYDLIFTNELTPDLVKKLKTKGYIVIIDTFAEMDTAQSAIAALKAYCQNRKEQPSFEPIKSSLKEMALAATPLIQLSPLWGMTIATAEQDNLDKLIYSDTDRVQDLLKCEKIRSMRLIDVKDIVAADWVADHCRWGCSSYGTKCCPPNSPTYKETETRLTTYHRALLIEGEPPTRDFQRLMLRNEKIAFKAGFYKAFAYWAGPCSLCTECKMPEPPLKCTATRPSMESAGIDVFATVRKQGYSLKTLKEKNEFVKYFGILLLD